MKYPYHYSKVIAIQQIDFSGISKHPNYPIFSATLKHFFDLGKANKVAALHKLKRHPGMSDSNLQAHLLDVDDWVSAFSYVLKPDGFMSLFNAVKNKDSGTCSKVYEVIISELGTEAVYPKKEIKNTGTLTIPVNDKAEVQLTLMTFCHGEAQSPYASGYTEALTKSIKKMLHPDQNRLNEAYIFKTEEACTPVDDRLIPAFRRNQTKLAPLTKDFSPINFNRADKWIAGIKAAQGQYPESKSFSKLSTNITHGMLTYSKDQFISNIQDYPFIHTWGTLTNLVVEYDQNLTDYSLTNLNVNDWLAQTLMTIDLALQIHEQLIQSPKNTVVVAGASHDYQLRLFLNNPTEIYTTLCKIFHLDLLKTPPKTSQELLNWIQTTTL